MNKLNIISNFKSDTPFVNDLSKYASHSKYTSVEVYSKPLTLKQAVGATWAQIASMNNVSIVGDFLIDIGSEHFLIFFEQGAEVPAIIPHSEWLKSVEIDKGLVIRGQPFHIPLTECETYGAYFCAKRTFFLNNIVADVTCYRPHLDNVSLGVIYKRVKNYACELGDLSSMGALVTRYSHAQLIKHIDKRN